MGVATVRLIRTSIEFEYFSSAFLATLKEPLDKYITRWHGLVKLYRTGKRVGLIEARTLGAQKSTGDAIVILDAHCECVCFSNNFQ
jgi:hypothetical protein